MSGEEILQWRLSHGLTQQQLADLLGLTILAIKHWENGRRQPPWYLKLALERLDQLLAPDPEPVAVP